MANVEIKPSCQLLFSGSVKKLSRRGFWQYRILSLDSRGNIYIATKGISSFQENTKSKPPINVTQSDIVRRQGKASDGRWPSKLDLRQSLVLECITTKFLFFPSIRAVEALNTQLDILCCRKCSEEKIDISTERDTSTEIGVEVETDKRESCSKRLSLCDDAICRDNTDKELTTKIEREIDQNKVSEVCIDFTSGPGYLSCKRATQTIRDTPDNTVTTQHSKRTSLFSPNTQFTLKPILKRHSDYYYSREDKASTISRVRFNTSPSVRIVSVVSNSDTQQVETDYIFRYINKYVVDSHKNIYKTENDERNNRISLLLQKIVK